MKQVFFLFVLSAINILSFAQSNPLVNAELKTPEKSRWDLDRYIWSHTHYKNKESDKPAIDFDAIDNWLVLGKDISISPNGKFFSYTIDRGPGGVQGRKLDSLVIQSIDNSWRKAYYQFNSGFFSPDSKKYIFLDKGMFYFLPLGKDKPATIGNVISYKINDKTNEWLAYQLKGSESTLVLQELKTGREKRFAGEYNYSFDNSNTWFLLQPIKNKDLYLLNLKTGKEINIHSVFSNFIASNGRTMAFINDEGGLSFKDLATLNTREIWKPTLPEQKIKDFKLDGSGDQVLFVVEDENKQISIWYWKQGMESAAMKINSSTKGIENGVLQPSASFTDNNRYIQFSFTLRPEERKPMDDAVQLNIWTYTDTVLQSTQSHINKNPVSFIGIADPENGSTIILGDELYTRISGDWALVTKKASQIYGDRFWEEDYDNDSTWVLSLMNGRRFTMPASHRYFFSPGGKYLVYFDPKRECHYFSYDLAKGDLKDISINVPSCTLGLSTLFLHTNDKPDGSRGIAAWIEGDKGALIYDNYDIWQLDLEGKKPALNLTNGFGRSNSIIFSLLNQHSTPYEIPLKSSESVILTSFSFKNKYNGFYRLEVAKVKNPEKLYMGSCFFQSPGYVSGLVAGYNGRNTLKASNKNSWIIQMQTATNAPNYFITRDFKRYDRLTNLQPQKKYNWLNAELISFKQLDGTESQGILYKPENFDSSKKYPVIVSFYGQLSDRLYQYLEPEYLINPNVYTSPSWLVSHGYLIFMPDIYFTQGQWGRSVVNTMEGVARYLKSLSYVDSSHIGATGHSNAGRFGYYLLTHSSSFAAMSLGSGFTGTDLISLALSLSYNEGTSNLEWAEKSAFGGGGLGNLWENKDKWIDHTAVLQADKATSPLLLFHNTKDGDDMRAAVELYSAFRRLEKPIWWLEYNEGGHTVTKVRDQRDFTIRYIQYFDHFLKGAPAPRWMKEGLPFKLKGIESRYEINNY